MENTKLAFDSINAIRHLSIDSIEKSNSGHPGLPLGAAPMASVLWQNHLKHNPSDPSWPDRDRFVLSAGHGSMLLYALLHLSGYDVSMDDLKNFRQWKAKTPGHPESFMTPGVEATTGPLGQGTGNAVGMALAERSLAERFNKKEFNIVDHYTYALVSDGDLMEGISAEAASLAGHLGLGKLIYLYDANDITLDGPVELSFSGEDVCKRYESYGWQVLRVENGDEDIEAIDKAIATAKKETTKPTLIWVHTTIGYGSPNKAGKAAAHGSPLGSDEAALTKKSLGLPDKTFFVAEHVKESFSGKQKGAKAQNHWKSMFAEYEKAYPELGKEFIRRFKGDLPDGWDAGLPSFKVGDAMATRSAGGQVLNAIASNVPELIGGDADLGCSTKTVLKSEKSLSKSNYGGKNIHYGVREHAMGAMQNGMAYHGGLRSYSATFFCFSDYMRPSVRIAALSSLPCIYVWTHDSIGLGEDGPTHQPVEHLMSLRAMPNLWVMRPADANETKIAWQAAIARKDGPVALVMSRQNLPVLENTTSGAEKGAYVVAEGEDGILLATGSEVSLALEAKKKLSEKGKNVRVVSMPCWELFEKQDAAYKESVLPSKMSARVSVEAGATLGWHRYLGFEGSALGVDTFGASAPAKELYKHYGLTADNICERFLALS